MTNKRISSRKFSPETAWPILLAEIANGASLTAALHRLHPSPSYWWAKDQLRRNPELRVKYHEAVEDRADRLAEELLELADSSIPQGLDGPGKSAWVQKLRLQVDTRKWIACKLKPRQYGERIDLEVKHTSISITAALAEADGRVLMLKQPKTKLSHGFPIRSSRAYQGGLSDACRSTQPFESGLEASHPESAPNLALIQAGNE